MKVNCNKIGIFTRAGVNPQEYMKPLMIDGKSIISEIPNAVKAIGIYNDGADIVRIEIPIDKQLHYSCAGGSACTTGGSYPSLSWEG